MFTINCPDRQTNAFLLILSCTRIAHTKKQPKLSDKSFRFVNIHRKIGVVTWNHIHFQQPQIQRFIHLIRFIYRFKYFLSFIELSSPFQCSMFNWFRCKWQIHNTHHFCWMCVFFFLLSFQLYTWAIKFKRQFHMVYRLYALYCYLLSVLLFVERFLYPCINVKSSGNYDEMRA